MTRKTTRLSGPKVVRLQPVNVSKLARDHGPSRSTVRERLRKGWRPPPVDVQRREDEPEARPAASPPPRPPLAELRRPIAIPRLLGAVILAIAAMGVAGLALTINAQ